MSEKLKILIVDDDRAIARALGVRLKAAGWESVWADSGTAGLARAADSAPDAALLDIRLPDFDGFEVHRRLQQSPETAGIPVVFLSANAKDDARQRAMASGAAGFVSKPYDPADVVSALRKACEAKRSAG